MSHPIDACMLFMPRHGGEEGEYSLLGPFGWLDCNDRQNAFLESRKPIHVPATTLRVLGEERDDGQPICWGGMAAFSAFVVPWHVRKGTRCCSRCGLPGHNRRSCRFPEPVLPDEEVA